MSFLSDIASAFAGIPGVEAVALAGSAVCQKADSLSDYDLYVYWQRPCRSTPVRRSSQVARLNTNSTIPIGS
jgi:hypothetical protein